MERFAEALGWQLVKLRRIDWQKIGGFEKNSEENEGKERRKRREDASHRDNCFVTSRRHFVTPALCVHFAVKRP